MCLNDFPQGIRHLRNPMALIKNGPYNDGISVKLKQKCENLSKY